MDNELESVIKLIRTTLNITDIDNMKHAMLMKQNKETLVGFVQNLTDKLTKSHTMLKSAAAKIDVLKNDQLNNQKSLLTLQEELIKNKSDQIDSFKTTVKTEIMKSWTDVVKQSCSKSVMPVNKLKEAVKSAVIEEDQSRNIIIFGVDEELGEDDEYAEFAIDDRDMIGKVFDQIEVKLRIEEHYRVGVVKPGSKRPRPIKMRLSRSDSVMQVLANAKKLKDGPALTSSVFLAPDRSKEERAAHKLLVEEMKKKNGEQSNKYFFIRHNKICCTDKLSNTAKSTPGIKIVATA